MIFRYNQLKENVHKLRSNIEEERIHKEESFDSKIRDLIDIEHKFSATIENEVKVGYF